MRLLVLATAALAAPAAFASSPVTLTFTAGTYAAEYSQGLSLELELKDAQGAAIDGTSACGDRPCRVRVELREDGGASVVQVTAPDVAVDAAGRARVRLTLVDGRHGGATFQSAPDGLAHTLTGIFGGAGVPLPDVTDADCQPGASGAVDGRLCPASATAPLVVRPEVPALTFNQDLILGIGESATLVASLEDDTGDAELAGDAADGTAPKAIVGVPIRFFYDVDADGRPSGDERLGEAITDDEGVARFEFTADPAFVTAGVFDAGLHAEFPGDARYAVARTSTRITINATTPDAARTIIEVDPSSIAANGVDEAVVRVRLVDAGGNILGADADVFDVAITADLGRLIDGVERDALDGTYAQVVRSGRQGGTARISVTVDGEDAGSATLTIEGDEGCTCGAIDAQGGLLVVLAAVGARRRRMLDGARRATRD